MIMKSLHHGLYQTEYDIICRQCCICEVLLLLLQWHVPQWSSAICHRSIHHTVIAPSSRLSGSWCRPIQEVIYSSWWLTCTHIYKCETVGRLYNAVMSRCCWVHDVAVTSCHVLAVDPLDSALQSSDQTSDNTSSAMHSSSGSSTNSHPVTITYIDFSASSSTLGVSQDGQLARKENWVMRWWRGYLSGVRCKWLAYVPADATVTSSSLLQ